MSQSSARSLLLPAIVLMLGASVWLTYHLYSQQLRVDAWGNVTGSGLEQFHYPKGELKRDLHYVDGVPVRSVWYQPDGTIIADEDWSDGQGMMYYVRDDGSIVAKVPIVDGEIHGKKIRYDEAGNVVSEQYYEKGSPVGAPLN